MGEPHDESRSEGVVKVTGAQGVGTRRDTATVQGESLERVSYKCIHTLVSKVQNLMYFALYNTLYNAGNQ